MHGVLGIAGVEVVGAVFLLGVSRVCDLPGYLGLGVPVVGVVTGCCLAEEIHWQLTFFEVVLFLGTFHAASS